jgi:hypothetical protein
MKKSKRLVLEIRKVTWECEIPASAIVPPKTPLFLLPRRRSIFTKMTTEVALTDQRLWQGAAKVSQARQGRGDPCCFSGHPPIRNSNGRSLGPQLAFLPFKIALTFAS